MNLDSPINTGETSEVKHTGYGLVAGKSVGTASCFRTNAFSV